MTGFRRQAVVHLFVACATAGTYAAADDPDNAGIRAQKRLVALRIAEPIAIDGALTEPAWARADVATDFYQQEPVEGALTTEPSEVRFLYDDEALYIGGMFHDSDPRGGITNELKRDFSPRDGDLITVVLDTFNDRRNSFAFMINPAGAQRDSQSYDDGRQNNSNWDGVWWVKTASVSGGWTMEMKIPFRTLRFSDAREQVWGMNVFRLIRRKNEVTLWTPVPRQFNQFKVSYAGTLEGIRDVQRGRNLQIKPFVTASGTSERTGARAWDADGGADLKYGIGSALALDLTYRTDFSQIEADEQQINLTRFSLFFPEKREFFLENQGAFRIGDQDSGGQSGGARRDLLPFFSRRIGLAPDGQPLPIVGGARLTGKTGPYSLGLLNIQSGAERDIFGNNFTAVRVGRELGGSSVAAFYLGREGGASEGSNRVAGAETHLKFRRTVDVYALAMRSTTTGLGDGTAARVSASVDETLYRAVLAYTNISERFRDDLGFVPRGNIALTTWDAARHIRPRGSSTWLRSITFGGTGEVFQDSQHLELQSRTLRAYTEHIYADGGTFTLDGRWNYERLHEPFKIRAGLFIPPGEYRFRQIEPSFTSNRSRALSGSFKYTGGEFYGGTLQGFDGGLRVRVNERLATSLNYAHNRVELPQGAFNAEIARMRVDFSFTTQMFLNAFVQYNSASRHGSPTSGTGSSTARLAICTSSTTTCGKQGSRRNAQWPSSTRCCCHSDAVMTAAATLRDPARRTGRRGILGEAVSFAHLR